MSTPHRFNGKKNHEEIKRALARFLERLQPKSLSHTRQSPTEKASASPRREQEATSQILGIFNLNSPMPIYLPVGVNFDGNNRIAKQPKKEEK
jgi:hypothetical protein